MLRVVENGFQLGLSATVSMTPYVLVCYPNGDAIVADRENRRQNCWQLPSAEVTGGVLFWTALPAWPGSAGKRACRAFVVLTIRAELRGSPTAGLAESRRVKLQNGAEENSQEKRCDHFGPTVLQVPSWTGTESPPDRQRSGGRGTADTWIFSPVQL
jgi:hypothetical protein